MTEPFDVREACRLTHEARAVEREFCDVSAWGRLIDRELLVGRLLQDDEAQERALAESRRLADLCARRARLWQRLADGLDDKDLDAVRESAEVIRQSAEDEFRRLEGEWCSAE